MATQLISEGWGPDNSLIPLSLLTGTLLSELKSESRSDLMSKAFHLCANGGLRAKRDSLIGEWGSYMSTSRGTPARFKPAMLVTRPSRPPIRQFSSQEVPGDLVSM